MYILYNHDGSIKRTKFSEFIQKGNNNVNEIFVSIDGLDTDDYLVYGSFELPNEEVVGPVVCSGPVTREIDGVEYSGYIISIHNGLTQYPGKVHASIVVTENVELNPQTLYTYPVVLTINDSAVAEVTQVTVQQYLQLLQEINKKLGISSNKYIKIIDTDNISSYEFDTSIYNVGDLVFNKGESYLMLYELYEDDDELKARGALLDLWLGDGASDITLYDEQRQLAIRDDQGNICYIDPSSGVIYKNGISSEKRRVVTKTSGSGTLSSAEVSMLNEFPSYIIISSGNDRLIYEHSETSASSLYFKQLITQTVVDSADDTKTYGETVITVNKSNGAYSTSIVETVFYPASVIDSKISSLMAVVSGKSKSYLVDYSWDFATVKTSLSSPSHPKAYLYDMDHPEATPTDITDEILNGDYDSSVVSNSIFNSTASEIEAKSSNIPFTGNKYLIFKTSPAINNWIIVRTYYAGNFTFFKMGDNIFVLNVGVPDRWSNGSYKLYINETSLANLVTLDTAQTISGEKTFSYTVRVISGDNGGKICFNSSGHREYIKGPISSSDHAIRIFAGGTSQVSVFPNATVFNHVIIPYEHDDINIGASGNYRWNHIYFKGDLKDDTYSLSLADIYVKGKLYLHELSWNDTGTSIASDAGTVHTFQYLKIITNSPTPFTAATINTRLQKELIRFPGTLTDYQSNTVSQGSGEVVGYIEQYANDTYIILEDIFSNTQDKLYLASTKINESSFSDAVTEL